MTYGDSFVWNNSAYSGEYMTSLNLVNIPYFGRGVMQET